MVGPESTAVWQRGNRLRESYLAIFPEIGPTCRHSGELTLGIDRRSRASGRLLGITPKAWFRSEPAGKPDPNASRP